MWSVVIRPEKVKGYMKIFTSLLDIVLLPVAIVKDVVTAPIKLMDPYDDRPLVEKTREQVERIDIDLKG